MFHLWSCVTQCYTLYPQNQSNTRKRHNWFLVSCVWDRPEENTTFMLMPNTSWLAHFPSMSTVSQTEDTDTVQCYLLLFSVQIYIFSHCMKC